MPVNYSDSDVSFISLVVIRLTSATIKATIVVIVTRTIVVGLNVLLTDKIYFILRGYALVFIVFITIILITILTIIITLILIFIIIMNLTCYVGRLFAGMARAPSRGPTRRDLPVPSSSLPVCVGV